MKTLIAVNQLLGRVPDSPEAQEALQKIMNSYARDALQIALADTTRHHALELIDQLREQLIASVERLLLLTRGRAGDPLAVSELVFNSLNPLP